MTDTYSPILEEFLALVEQERLEALAKWGDDFENNKLPSLLLAVAVAELGKLAAGIADDREDFADAMVDIQQQAVVVAGLLASIYEQADKHRIEYLDALGELTEDDLV
ncbi:MAG: hypothetical protein CVT67_02940 [Actinobacteria bacterium HGW-Actinobacteria-7]|jgi:hypothetical protein|nr:MAG: hypothetical protein CVT67_02940 [Actinobacteria bacterium HGW-Actinobacteria-7]